MDDNKTTPSPSAPNPTRRKLAQGSLATVEACSCGTLHIHVGAISLRMMPKEASDFVAALELALANCGLQAFFGPTPSMFPAPRRGEA